MKRPSFNQVRRLATGRGGQISASILEQRGWDRQNASSYLQNLTVKGFLKRTEPGTSPLNPGPWEPVYFLAAANPQ